MFKPLNFNEANIVKQHLRNNKLMNDEMLESTLKIWEWEAKKQDVPTFDIFCQLAQKPERTSSEDELPRIGKRPELTAEKLISFLEDLPEPEGPLTHHEWLYGDVSYLSNENRRLRVKFFNSTRYRENILESFVAEGLISNTNDMAHIEDVLKNYADEYGPKKTDQQRVHVYDIFFGERDRLPGACRLSRDQYFADQEYRSEVLMSYQLSPELSDDEVKSHFLKMKEKTVQNTP